MDGQQFLVENARRKASIDALVVEQLKEIFLFARAAAGDDGHIHPGSDRVQHLEIEAGADTIGVNAVQADLPRAMRHAPADPFQRVPAGILAPALGKHPELAVHPLHVDVYKRQLTGCSASPGSAILGGDLPDWMKSLFCGSAASSSASSEAAASSVAAAGEAAASSAASSEAASSAFSLLPAYDADPLTDVYKRQRSHSSE